MSLQKIHDLLQEAGWPVTEIDDSKFSVGITSHTSNRDFAALFRKAKESNEYIEGHITFSVIRPYPDDPQVLCRRLNAGEPRLHIHFNQALKRFGIVYTFPADDFSWEMSKYMVVCDHMAQLLIQNSRRKGSITLAQMKLAFLLPAGLG